MVFTHTLLLVDTTAVDLFCDSTPLLSSCVLTPALTTARRAPPTEVVVDDGNAIVELRFFFMLLDDDDDVLCRQLVLLRDITPPVGINGETIGESGRC